ncbi:hypothetical protein SNE40_017072 [Patella caerulea]|uniref:Uncharacterized protein n=1 Tax=Patella caerulea TaxID=87958 RepID=A0AAN8JD00_PATCE
MYYYGGDYNGYYGGAGYDSYYNDDYYALAGHLASSTVGTNADVGRPAQYGRVGPSSTPLSDSSDASYGSSSTSSTDVKVSTNITFSDSTIIIIITLFAAIGVITITTLCFIRARRRRRLRQPGIEIGWTHYRRPTVPPRKDLKMIDEGKSGKRALPPIPVPLPGQLMQMDEKIRQTAETLGSFGEQNGEENGRAG